MLIIDTLDTSLSSPLDRYHGNTSGSIVERCIESRASEIFGYPINYMYGPGLLIAASVPHDNVSTVRLGYIQVEIIWSIDIAEN